jgi:hypothetical protein
MVEAGSLYVLIFEEVKKGFQVLDISLGQSQSESDSHSSILTVAYSLNSLVKGPFDAPEPVVDRSLSRGCGLVGGDWVCLGLNWVKLGLYRV